MNDSHWGYHLMLNCGQGDIEKVISKENIQNYVKNLVDHIDMVAYGPLFLERFATHDSSKGGFSFCQMIMTSNICGHFVDISGDFYIDIFSCKPFDIDEAIWITKEFFNPKALTTNFIFRDAPLPE